MTANSQQSDILIDTYLDQLALALRDLPPSRRDPIVEEVTAHIATARALLPQETEAAIHQLLDQLGDPYSIRAEAGLPPVSHSRIDPWIPWLLLLGGFVFVVGWIFAVVVLWQSRVWHIQDKILGTLMWPVLFCGSVLFLGIVTIGPTMTILVPILGLFIVIGGPVLETIHLLKVYQKETKRSVAS